MATTLIAAALAASLSAKPAQLVLGKDGGAELEVHAPSSAKITLTSSIGTITDPSRSGDVMRARFNPPAHRSPSVALVLAQIDEGGDRELSWLAIPLTGSDTMEIETRPGATVEADVAGRRVGPVTADKNGRVKLAMVVPPGVQKAALKITDTLGNHSERALDLEPPSFSRLRVAARSSSASALAPAEFEIFVVRPDGAGDDSARIQLSSEEGEAQIVRRIDHGVYLARFSPAHNQSGTARVAVTANGQNASLEMAVRPGKAVLGSPMWRTALAPQRPWSISAGLIGGVGATFDGAAAGTAMLEAAMRLEVLPIEALFDLGGSLFADVNEAGPDLTNISKAGAKTGFLQLGLRAGMELIPGLDGHATFSFGVQDQSVSTTLFSGQVVDQSGWTPRFSFALGANLRLGPGRLLAQVQADHSGSGVARLSGSLSSLQFMAGYLATVR